MSVTARDIELRKTVHAFSYVLRVISHTDDDEVELTRGELTHHRFRAFLLMSLMLYDRVRRLTERSAGKSFRDGTD